MLTLALSPLAWMRLVEPMDRMEQPERVGSWLAATARNESLRHVAARKRIVPVHQDVGFDGADHHGLTAYEALLGVESARVVNGAMACPPDQWTRVRHQFPLSARASQGSTTSAFRPAGNALTSMSTCGQDDGGMRVCQSGGR